MTEHRLEPVYGEDYERFYGKLDYSGKRVLDIGADVGSTADFFLLKGAKDVIAVEPDEAFYKELVANAEKIDGLHPIKRSIEGPGDLAGLYELYSPDIVKMDCEGCEIHALALGDDAFTIPTGYVVETHSAPITTQWILKLLLLSYEIVSIDNWVEHVSIITALRRAR
jgi:hypothetical protein